MGMAQCGFFRSGTSHRLRIALNLTQIESARRFKVDLARWPRLLEIDAACAGLEAFRRAAPGVQPDAS